MPNIQEYQSLDSVKMSHGASAIADANGHLLSQSDAFVVVVSRLGRTGGTIWELFGITRGGRLLQNVTKEYDTDSGQETLYISIQFNESKDGSYRVDITGEKVPTYEKYSPAFALKKCFDNKMKSEGGHALFQDFSTYIKHLPFRQSKNGVWQKLCHSSYYAREDDLNLMVNRLEVGAGDLARPTVYYAVAPTGSGKTASMAAVFVQSAKGNKRESFTHYLYIAFSNNKDRNFVAHGAVSDDATQAQNQGADFMVRCVECLLNDNLEEGTPKSIQISQNPRNEGAYSALLNDLFQGIRGRILLHLDEHRRMNDNGHFRRGAMKVLAKLHRVVVVATFVEPPLEVPSDESSEICRSPVAIPLVDVEKVLEIELECPLDRNKVALNAKCERLLSTLLFRCGDYLRGHLNSVHLVGRCSSDYDEFRKKFAPAVVKLNSSLTDASAMEDALKDCISCFPFERRAENLPTGCRAEHLLLGMDQAAIDRLGHKVGTGLIAYSIKGSEAPLFTASVRAIGALSGSGDIEMIVRRGYSFFRSVFANGDDILADTPLERAFLWTLSTSSAVYGQLDFLHESFVPAIKCGRIEKGRIFKDSTLASFDLATSRSLQVNTIYCADEGNGQNSHPYGDIFFKTENNRLVLIDVTGSTDAAKCQTKMRRLVEWVNYADRTQWLLRRRDKIRFTGIVLAPLVPGESHFFRHQVRDRRGRTKTQLCQRVRAVVGADAIELLGGLAQFLTWFQ